MRTGDERFMAVDELEELIDEEPQRPRAWLVGLFSVLVLIVVVVLLVLAQKGGRALAELRVRDDTVEVKSGSEFQRGIEGQALDLGDSVRTDADGQAQIDYFDGSLTRLDTDTTFVIRELASTNESKRIRLKVDAGNIFNRVEKLSSSKDRFEMSGPTAVATVRGTMNFVFAEQAPIEYYLGYTGTTVVTFEGVDFVLDKRNECVRVDQTGMRKCTKHELDALMKTTFYRVNIALEGGDLPGRPALSPSASPSASPAPVLRRAPTAGSATTPTPATTRRPRGTDDPNETEEPTEEPTATPLPTPPEPTDTDGDGTPDSSDPCPTDPSDTCDDPPPEP